MLTEIILVYSKVAYFYDTTELTLCKIEPLTFWYLLLLPLVCSLIWFYFNQLLGVRHPAALASASEQNQRSPLPSLILVLSYHFDPGMW
jgi:hypothetical protein